MIQVLALHYESLKLYTGLIRKVKPLIIRIVIKVFVGFGLGKRVIVKHQEAKVEL